MFELPEETRSSTEAMRRAVSDQIRALRELSDIVSQSGRAFDVADRSRPAPARPQREAAPQGPARQVQAAPAQKPEPAKPEYDVSDDDAFDVEQEIAASFMTDGNLAVYDVNRNCSLAALAAPALSAAVLVVYVLVDNVDNVDVWL